MKGMLQRTKKQHIVPQFYLNAWSISGKHQIHVFDKTTEQSRINNIGDVAAEHCFYDANMNEVLPDEILEVLRKNGFELGRQEKTQEVEKALATEIEQPFSYLLGDIIKKAKEATPWHIRECFFISSQKKAELSAYLAYQYVRTKRVRNGIQDTADCLMQFFEDMGVSTLGIEQFAVSKEEAAKMHVQQLLDPNLLTNLTALFCRLSWILFINHSDLKLYTSDEPIGTCGHIDHPIMSMSGLSSKGVEAFFPISPDAILVMVDGSYHMEWQLKDRRYLKITDRAYIERYNALLATRANRDIYSCDGNFDLLKKMKSENPAVFQQPQMKLSNGDKDYFPRDRKR